jgi:hypothetical protein
MEIQPMRNAISPLSQLSQQLREPLEAGLASPFCQHCQGELYLFVSDELAGQPVDDLYPEIAYHLDICSLCLKEYEELANLTAAALLGEDTV